MAAGTLEMILVDGGILTGVVVAFILSLRMMFTAKTKNSLQFQLAVWLVIWTVSEIWRYLQTIGAVNFSQPVLLLGMGVHTVSMLAFAAFISYRFSKFIRR
ncbi:MAG: hypothetical protein AUF79_02005 [Crenarchaeota archaeon 13_1_20CM_2_51_8]|nr:MAG: hypothetical protein AUF79_02005 [Crenarchaeota archaeon 13_1_20CM_2_51_8]